ncbi:MAG: 16S rRNA (cytidine(1402)-2'-O)-methyltransferase [Thermodesulfobacteriota bacterium]
MPGTLFVVATPLGNLEDMTLRAIKVLKEADLVAAEDTRRTRKMLTHFGLSRRLLSYREQNHARVLPQIMTALVEGLNVALVTDAGTPVISDPGARLIREAAASGVLVSPVPGPSAVTAALSVSGLPADQYHFAGYLPARRKPRLETLNRYKQFEGTLVIFEAPHRLLESLGDAARVLGDRSAVLCRELTKVHEEVIRGGLAELADTLSNRPFPVKGEITLVVAGAGGGRPATLSQTELRDLIKEDPRPAREIAGALADRSDLNRSDLYRLILEVRGRLERSSRTGGE